MGSRLGNCELAAPGKDFYSTTDDPHSWRPGPVAGGGRKGDSSIPSIYLPNESFYGLFIDLATENIWASGCVTRRVDLSRNRVKWSPVFLW